MSKLLVIGGSKGIGKAILSKHLKDRECVNISRTQPDVPGSYEHHGLDVLTDDLPDIENLQSIVYCPGSINLKPIGSLKEEDFRKDFDINVLGAVRVVKKFHRQLKKVPGASIVLFSTVAVAQGMAFHASVAASKGAVEGLTKTLAAELSPNVRVNAIAPTITDTPLASSILKNEEMRRKMSDRHPLKRIIKPDEIAALAAYLISEDSASMTGQILQGGAGITSIR